MNWPCVALRQVAPPVPSKVQFSQDELVWHLGLDQIVSHTGQIINKRMATPQEAGNSTFLFDSGNVLYSKLRPYLNKVVRPAEPGIATTELVPLRPVPGILLPEFLAHYLRSPEFLGFAESCVAGAKMPRVIMSKLWEKPIPLPPPTEQRRIVEILDQADAIRTKRREVDALAAGILPALFRKMFGDPVTNPMDWKCETVGSVADVSYGLSEQLDHSLTADRGTRILTISNVTLTGEIDPSVQRYTLADEKGKSKASVQENDLLFNWRNGSAEHVGKTAIWENNWPEEILHVSFLLRIRPCTRKVEPYYLWSLLNLLRASGFFIAQARMQVNSKFNASEMQQLKLPLPQRDLQTIFARRVSALREYVRQARISAVKIKDLFDVLSNQAFAGTLTARWREAHISALSAEMEEQARILVRIKASDFTTA